MMKNIRFTHLEIASQNICGHTFMNNNVLIRACYMGRGISKLNNIIMYSFITYHKSYNEIN